MIECIKDLPSTICNIIEYNSCGAVEYVTKRMIMNKFRISGNYTYNIEKQGQLKEGMATANSVPLEGERWLLVVDIDKLGVSEAIKALDNTISTAIVLYVTHNYQSYKKLIDSVSFKQQLSTNFAKQIYLGKLTDAAIDTLYDFYLMGMKKTLDSKLMVYIKKNYKYNVDLVCELFLGIKNGNVPKSEKEIIEMVGVGGNTPQALTISLLTTSTKTDRGKKAFLKKNIGLFEDLSVKYTYEIAYGYMISTLRGIVDIKQLQISGRYNDFYKDIPDTFDERRKQRINRLKRFEYIILNKITLRRTLVLLQCMQSKDYDKKQVILEGIYKYVNSLG